MVQVNFTLSTLIKYSLYSSTGKDVTKPKLPTRPVVNGKESCNKTHDEFNKPSPFTVIDPATFKSPEVEMLATTFSFSSLNSTKLGVAPFFGNKQCRLR